MTGVPAVRAEALSAERERSALSLYIATTKPGITRMVTLSAVVGFIVSACYHGLSFGALVWPAVACVLGTAIAASGANAMNQWAEKSRDAVMRRTQSRPLPSGQLRPTQVLVFSAVLSVAGPLLLAMSGFWVAALLTFATVVLYVGVYTPMKAISPLSTVVGAVPGAVPILVGWTVASPDGLGDLARWPAWSLFGVLFAWQMPHFLAIAVMYRDDYARAGYRTLLQTSRRGGRVLASMAAWSIVMVVASITPLLTMPGLYGWGYAVTAVILGVWMVLLVAKLGRTLAADGARTLFFASIIYLPVIFIALVVDACLGAGLTAS